MQSQIFYLRLRNPSFHVWPIGPHAGPTRKVAESEEKCPTLSFPNSRLRRQKGLKELYVFAEGRLKIHIDFTTQHLPIVIHIGGKLMKKLRSLVFYN